MHEYCLHGNPYYSTNYYYSLMKISDWGKTSIEEKVRLFFILLFIALIGIVCLMPLWLTLWGTTNHIPAKYTYTVVIQDLSSCTSEGGVEILVPIPYVNGQQVFTDRELNVTSGSWHSRVKTTEHGKMLSLTHPDDTLDTAVFNYNKLAPNLISADAAGEVCLGPYFTAASQDATVFKEELDRYETATRHGIDENWIKYSDPDGWAIGNTTVEINGNIWKPEMRKTIVADMQFEAWGPVPDGCQPLIYAVRSSAEMSDTNNATYSPEVLSYLGFRTFS